MPRAVGLALSCLLAALAPVSGASAHDPPKGIALVWPIAASDAPPVALTNRGLVFAEPDASGLFSLRCNEAYGVTTTALPALLADAAGGLVLIAPRAVSATADRGCSWQAGEGLPESLLGGFAQHPSEPGRLLLTTLEPDGVSYVLSSDDYGAHWSQLATNAPNEVYMQLVWAPSDAQRLYASGARVDRATQSATWLWGRSSDAGHTWEQRELSSTLTALAVHPTQPDVVFAYEEADPDLQRYRLLRSADRGDSFESVVEVSTITAFAASPDGSALWLGAGREGGLYRSLDAGASFERVHPEIREVHCLAYRDDALWVCANMAPNTDGVWVARQVSADKTALGFEAVLTFDQVRQPVVCEPEAALVCEGPWSDWELELLPYQPADDAGAEQPPPDAGAGPSPDADSGPEADGPPGSRCSLSVGAHAAFADAFVVALVCGLALRRPARKRASQRV